MRAYTRYAYDFVSAVLHSIEIGRARDGIPLNRAEPSRADQSIGRCIIITIFYHIVERVICEMDHYAFLCLPVYKFIRAHLNTHEYVTDSVCVCVKRALTVSIRAFTFHFHACLAISFFLSPVPFAVFFSRFVK